MRYFPGLLFLLFSAKLSAQQPEINCRTVKNGSFYLHPSKSNDDYMIERTDTIQYEKGLKSHNESWWRVNWTSDCSFHLTFLKTNRTLSAEEKQLWETHTVAVRINAVADAYYTFSAGLDSVNSSRFRLSDTCWTRKHD